MQISELIVHKNNQFLIFNKPAGLPVQADKTADKSLTDLASIYCKSPVFAVHRIDRPASGLVLFAKNKKSLAQLSQQFKDRSIQKTYLAVTQNRPAEDSGSLTHFVRDQLNNKAIATDEKGKHGKEARMNYKVIASSDRYHLLEIELLTGRHHQIRAQLAAIGCPIKGDVKYGFKRGNRDRSIHLHSWKIAFNHPVTMERIALEAPLPEGVIWQAMGEQFR